MLYDWAFIFFIYAFLGWCTEVVYAAVNQGRFVNRGFLNGPVCPIYGFGILFMVLILGCLPDNLWLMYGAGVVITSLLEFITGFILEKFFHEKWWDYSDCPFNIKGYVCLKFSLVWGLGVVFIMKIVHPGIMKVVHWLPHPIGIVLLCLFSAAIVTDLALTIRALIKLPGHLKLMQEAETLLHGISDGIGEHLSGGVILLQEKNSNLLKEIKERHPEKYEVLQAWIERSNALAKNPGAIYRRLFQAFPRLREGQYKGLSHYMRSLRDKHRKENQ